MSIFPSEADNRDLHVIEHMLASGQVLPEQMPSACYWTPEKKLAAAVFVGGLVEVRNHAHDLARRRRVAEELAWIFSNDTTWPYSFVRLCELFHLDPAYVRRIVRAWLEPGTTARKRMCSTHRHAA